MNKTTIILTAILILSGFGPFFTTLSAQTEEQNLTATILREDSLFWQSYNSCDVEKFRQFFTDDVEFYHDKGGLTTGLENFVASVQNNLCGNEDFRLRREVVAGSVRVFPLQNGGVTYGAILSGEHVFYIYGKNQAEQLDGRANFTHVWVVKDGAWKMSRILSYNHRPAR